MTQAVFSVRMDEALKRDFSAFCENVGMNMSTAIVIFAKTVVRERQFPFAISERPVMGRRNCADEVDKHARLAVERMRQRVEESDAEEPTMDEINAFISTARTQRRKIVKNPKLAFKISDSDLFADDTSIWEACDDKVALA